MQLREYNSFSVALICNIFLSQCIVMTPEELNDYVPDPSNSINNELSSSIAAGLKKEEIVTKIVPMLKEIRSDFTQARAVHIADSMVTAACDSVAKSTATGSSDSASNRITKEDIKRQYPTFRSLKLACMDRGIRGTIGETRLREELLKLLQKEEAHTL